MSVVYYTSEWGLLGECVLLYEWFIIQMRVVLIII